MSVLAGWRRCQNQERLLLGESYVGHDLVFTLADGRPYNPDRVSREFDRRLARHGLPRIRLHDLRHTWATLALESDIHPKVVQERLGHSSIAITLDLYSHVIRPMLTGAAETVADLVFGSVAE